MNIIQARIITKDFEKFMKDLEEARSSNALGDFTVLPHTVSEILTACDVEIEYCKSKIISLDDEEKIIDIQDNLNSRELMKESLLYVFNK